MAIDVADVKGKAEASFARDEDALVTNDGPAEGRVGRQMQTWIRMPDGWRIVAAPASTREG